MGVKAHPGMSSEKWLLISPVGLGYAIHRVAMSSKQEGRKSLTNG